jgi:hypothetical protein
MQSVHSMLCNERVANVLVVWIPLVRVMALLSRLALVSFCNGVVFYTIDLFRCLTALYIALRTFMTSDQEGSIHSN